MKIINQLVRSIANYFAEFKYSKSRFKKKIYNFLFVFSESFIFPNDKRLIDLIKLKRNNNKNIFIYILPIWGEVYSDAFFDHFLPSLLSKNNIWWLANNYNVKIFIYGDNIFEFKLNNNTFYNEQLKKLNTQFQNLDSFKQDKDRDYLSSIILNTYIEHATDCLKNNATSINLAADHILPSNYLKNLSTIIHGKPFCYSHSHMRVSTNILNSIYEYKKDNIIDISSDRLVFLSKKYPFTHIKHMNDELDSNLTHLGFSWREINDNNYAVVNGVIGTMTFNFIEDDINFLNSLNSWSAHDRQIPQYLLTSKRMKLISSSDLAFLAEVTYSESEFILKKNNKYNDLTKSNKLASNTWNSIVGNWRS